MNEIEAIEVLEAIECDDDAELVLSIILAIQALKEKQERDKGCEGCKFNSDTYDCDEEGHAPCDECGRQYDDYYERDVNGKKLVQI